MVIIYALVDVADTTIELTHTESAVSAYHWAQTIREHTGSVILVCPTVLNCFKL
jgi:hypothetical protein